MERNKGEEGKREAVRKRMEKKGEKGSEEDDYFNKFSPTMPSVVLENRSIRMFKVSYRFSRTTEGIVGENLLK